MQLSIESQDTRASVSSARALLAQVSLAQASGPDK